MAERGGQVGNQNAKKSRAFEQALIREIKQRDITDGEGETLRKIAAKWVDAALAGDFLVVGKEIRDTLDGKPAQALTGADGGAIGVIIQASQLDEAL